VSGRAPRDPPGIDKPSVDDASDSAELLADIRDGKWLTGQEFPPLRYAVPGLLPEGLSVLAGAPKVGKSWLVLDWLLAIAAGGDALGRLPVGRRRHVLYLALEDGDRRMQARCHTLLANEWRPDDEIPPWFEYLTEIQPGKLLATIDAWQQANQGGVVAVDTLGRALPAARMGETSYDRDYRVMRQLKARVAAWPGSSLLLSHHDRKATSADFVDSASGTKAITGGADTVLLLTRPRDDRRGLLQVTGRDIDEGSFAVNFDGGAWTLDGGTLDLAAKAAHERRPAGNLSDTSLDLLAAVNAASGPVSPADVSAAAGVSNDTAGKYLRRLAESGRVQKSGRGQYVSVSERPNVNPPHQEELGVSDTDTQTPRGRGSLMDRIEERSRRRK
jgi:AAA domain